MRKSIQKFVKSQNIKSIGHLKCHSVTGELHRAKKITLGFQSEVMPLNILDLVLFGQQEKLILCLESKIRLTISVVLYTKDIVFVAVTTLVKQLEILEQDLVNTNS